MIDCAVADPAGIMVNANVSFEFWRHCNREKLMLAEIRAAVMCMRRNAKKGKLT